MNFIKVLNSKVYKKFIITQSQQFLLIYFYLMNNLRRTLYLLHFHTIYILKVLTNLKLFYRNSYKKEMDNLKYL